MLIVQIPSFQCFDCLAHYVGIVEDRPNGMPREILFTHATSDKCPEKFSSFRKPLSDFLVRFK